MSRHLKVLVTLPVLVLAVVAVLAQAHAPSGVVIHAQSRPQDVELQAAIRTIAIGELKGAVQQLKAILAKYPGDRVVVAKALLQLAECYRRLGDAEAQKIYSRIATEYGDQEEAARVARARLAPGEPIVELNRQVWTVPKDASVAGAVSSDGRHVAYVDWSDAGKGDLFVHAFGGGADRRVTQTGNVAGTTWKRWADTAAFSRDGRQVAFSWHEEEKDRHELRVVGLTGTATPQSAVVVTLDEASWITPYDWSADGQWIAAIWKVRDGPRVLGMVSVKDGALRELKSFDRPCQCDPGLALSPDGKYLAFDMPAADTRARDIYVIDVATAAEMPAVVYAGNDALVGWAPDGKSIVFTSDRARPGANGLWSIPFAAGRPGTATPIRGELGPFDSHGMTASGAVYYCRCEPQTGSDIKIASFDFSTGHFLAAPVDAVQQFVGTNFQPFWSPDGKSFVYRSLRPNQDPILVVQDLASGETRELRPKLATLQSMRWTPDGQAMAVIGRDFNARFGWYRVDARTGRSSPLIIFPPGSSLWEVRPETSWSPDGQTYYYRREVRGVEFLFASVNAATGEEHVHLRLPGQSTLPAGLSGDHRTLYYQRSEKEGAAVLLARDRASGAERELLRRAHLGMRNDMMRTSPDERFVATTVDRSPETPEAVVLVVPTAGGDAREVFRTSSATQLSVVFWAPDGRSLVVRTPASPDRTSDFWWVPLDGRGPRKLTEFDALRPTGLFLHPDGKQILFGARPDVTAPGKPTEFWVLDGVVRK